MNASRGRQRSRSRRNALRTLRRRDTIGLLLLGKSGCGKSALVQRWLRDSYCSDYNPTVEDFYVKAYRHMGQCVNVGVIDMTGSWDFSGMMDLYLSRVDSVMLIYDVNDESSISELTHLHQRLLKVRGENHDVLLTAVGTKIDTRQEFEVEEQNYLLEKFVEENCRNCKHVVTSAKLKINVQEAFEMALNELVVTMAPNEDAIKRLRKLMEKNEKNGGCLKSCSIS